VNINAKDVIQKMLSEIPVKLENVEKKFLDREILRLAMIAELDAISLYEQLAAATTDENIKKVLLDVAKEEKTHVGEFQALLLKEDKQQVEELEKGEEEVKEIIE
jgi:rubrerythrin